MFTAIIDAYRFFFLRLADIVGIGWGIVVLSFITSAAMMPLMKAVAGVVRRETEYQDVILPQLGEIKRNYLSDMERNFHTQRLYARYGYSPLSAVKKVLPLFVQIPFLLLTYYMLKGTPQLDGVGFLFLRDLGRPDALVASIGLVPIGLNVLPLVMTCVNMLTVAATPGFTGRDQIQAVGISLLFLVLLYAAPSALLLYWTLNNAITLLRTLLSKRGAGARLLARRISAMRNLPIAFRRAMKPKTLAVACLFLCLTALYMRLMVAMEVWFYTYMIAYWLMCFAVAALIWVSYYCFLPKNSFSKRLWEIALIVAAAITGVLAFCMGSIFITMDILKIVTANVKLQHVFDAMFLAWLALVVSEMRKGWPQVLSSNLKFAFRQSGIWLLPIVAIAVHYSFSSANFKLSLTSVAILAAYMLIPAIALSMFGVCAYGRIIASDIIFRATVGFCLGAYLVPMISRETGKMLGYGNNLPIRIVLMVAVATIVAMVRRRKTAVVFVAFFAVAFLINAFLGGKAETNGNVAKTDGGISETERVFSSLELVRTNNVYLLVYDSYSHDIVLDALGIPHADLASELPKRGFTRYEAYSLGDNTLPGMASAFSLGGIAKGSWRSVLAGNNVFCDCLRKAGYRTSYVLCGYDMPKRGECMPGDFYFPAPQKTKRPEMVLFPCILRGILSQSPNTFNSYTSKEWLDTKRQLILESNNGRNFIYAHSPRPGHAVANPAYRKSDVEEREAFKKRIGKADDEMRDDLDAIFSNDPDPLIIIAADHGAYMVIPEKVGEFSAFDILDRCGIQLYVRWPKGYLPTLDINVFPDVFLEALICLSGDKSLARFKSDGVTLPLQYPLKAPAGAVRNCVVQFGSDKGRNLFDAARKCAESFEQPVKSTKNNE